ncbi:MAG: ribosome small subunit-dependent GTPase A [marine benthic group bacterium]|nr:ribosome small subunit-dependent GTPase A [Gemmatimonadota bacterium]
MTESLGAFGWDEDWAAAFERLSVSGRRPARVTAQHRERWTIQTEEGARSARLLRANREGPVPVTGDWVVVAPGPHESDPWSVLSVLPRRSEVRRGSAGEARSEQVIASNVDRLWIVQALDRAPNLRSLERYLAVAWESGASPEIVLTKSDLAADPEDAAETVRTVAFGVPVRVVSAADGAAVASLRATLAPGQTVALLGPSGAGKSTLINLLAGVAITQTGEVRAGDRKGRHTTTGRELYPIEGGALLLDTPGMRELKVLDLEQGLQQAFPEIAELSAQCRFRDCSHSSEPGCAVTSAVDEGRLTGERLASYRKLQAEAAHERRRTDPRARAEHVGEWKTAMKTLKHHPKYRRGE